MDFFFFSFVGTYVLTEKLTNYNISFSTLRTQYNYYDMLNVKLMFFGNLFWMFKKKRENFYGSKRIKGQVENRMTKYSSFPYFIIAFRWLLMILKNAFKVCVLIHYRIYARSVNIFYVL